MVLTASCGHRLRNVDCRVSCLVLLWYVCVKCAPSDYLHMAMRCDVGLVDGILTELSLCCSILYHVPFCMYVPRTRLRVGERAFSSAAPRLWNTLPTDIKRAATLLTFKKKLQTFLFSKHLCWFYCILSPPFYYKLHIYISVNSWSSSHVSCIVCLD